MNMSRPLITMLLLPGLLLSGCALEENIRRIDLGEMMRVGQQAFAEVSQEQEVEIGTEAAAVLLGAAPLHKNQNLQRYVNHVGLWIAQQSERPELPWKFAVIDTDSVNAFAAPGGHVFITSGLLQHLQSEAELAGVLGHEIAHVLQKHHLKAVQQGARLDLAQTLVSSQLDAERQAQLQRISGSFRELYARGLDRDDEYEADRMGVILAARAGYDPYGLPAVLQALHALNAQDSSLALLFKTHPAPAQRLARLETFYPELDRYAGQPTIATRFRQQVRVLN